MSQDTTLTSEEIREVTLETLSEVVELKVEGEVYTQEDILHTLVAAAADHTTIEQACEDLENGCHSTTVRYRLQGLERDEGEAQLNAGLISAIPLKLDRKRWKVAGDIPLHPYYGEVTDSLRDSGIRSAAKAGTTRFFGYATVYGVKKNQRYPLGLHILRQNESLGEVLALLLSRGKELGVRLKRLSLARGFYSSAGCRSLQEHRIPALMPGGKKGKKGGIRKLVVGRESSRTTYPLRTQKTKASATIDVAIVCTYQKGKRGKRGCRLFGYAFFNYTPCLSGLHKD